MAAPPNFQPAAGVSLPDLPDFVGQRRADPRARAAYAEGAGIFRIVPAAVAVPSTTSALRDLVLWAARRRVPLVPRGAGSGIGGGNVGRGVVVDLTALDGCPIELRGAARIAFTGAGATMRDLASETERAGLRLPPNPSSSRFATLGGMVSTNASGPRSVRSGSVRTWIEALDLITADGESLTLRRGIAPRDAAVVQRFARTAAPAIRRAGSQVAARFPRTRKNSSGYALDAWLESDDLIDLVVGSEGTLAMVTGIEWRLEPIPVRYAGIRAGLNEATAIGKVVPPLLSLDPAAVEYLDESFLRFVGEAAEGTAGLLMVEFEGSEADPLPERLREARRILRPHSVTMAEATDRRALEQLWQVRHGASPALARLGETRRSLQVIEDACVPVEALARYLEAVRAAGARHGIELVAFGHAGDGHLHVNLLPDVTRDGWQAAVAAVYQEITAVVIGLGGTLSGEHGDGRLRTRSLPALYGPEIMELFRLVKDAFDPVGILNPGIKLPEAAERPFESLKVGHGAAPLPPDIEQGLREIEREARYGVSRLELA